MDLWRIAPEETRLVILFEGSLGVLWAFFNTVGADGAAFVAASTGEYGVPGCSGTRALSTGSITPSGFFTSEDSGAGWSFPDLMDAG